MSWIIKVVFDHCKINNQRWLDFDYDIIQSHNFKYHKSYIYFAKYEELQATDLVRDYICTRCNYLLCIRKEKENKNSTLLFTPGGGFEYCDQMVMNKVLSNE